MECVLDKNINFSGKLDVQESSNGIVNYVN